MPSKRKSPEIRALEQEKVTHVGKAGSNDSWCGERVIPFLCMVRRCDLLHHGPPDLSADPRVCQRCVAAMQRAWKETQG